MIGTSLVGWRTLTLYQTEDIEAPIIIHLDKAAADLVSNPTIKFNIGTKIPPPPTPPTVPNADPKNPMVVAIPLFQLTSNSYLNKRSIIYINIINIRRSIDHPLRKKKNSPAKLVPERRDWGYHWWNWADIGLSCQGGRKQKPQQEMRWKEKREGRF